MSRINKVARISLSGGIIGLIFTNPRSALEQRLARENADGWSAVQITPHKDTNLFIALVRSVVLVVTLFLWTWGAGYLILLEKER
jgi:hypothetical protein